MTPVYVDDAATLSSRCEKRDSVAPAGGRPLARTQDRRECGPDAVHQELQNRPTIHTPLAGQRQAAPFKTPHAAAGERMS
jgi:hypothetical protein